MNAHSILLAALENSRLASGQLGRLGDALRATDRGQADSETAMRQALEAIAMGRLAAGQAAAIAGELAANQAAVAAALVELERLLRPLPVTRSGMPYLWGIRQPANSWEVMTRPGGKYDQLQDWVGREVDIILCYLGKDIFDHGWDRFNANYVLGGTEVEPKGQMAGIYARGAIPVLSMPMMPTSLARRYDLGAKGEFDAPQRAVARRCGVIAESRGLILRLAWEGDEGYPWSRLEIGKGEAIPFTEQWRTYWKDTWRRVVDIWREEVLGVVIVENHLRNTRCNVGEWFPGNSHVDVIAIDAYDNGYGGYVIDEASWERFAGVCENDSFTGPRGMLDWAEQKGLQAAFCEWGCVNTTPIDPSKPAVGDNLSPTSPTNNGFYVNKMVDLFQDAVRRRLLKYESYFMDGTRGRHQIWPETPWNARVREAYLARYRQAAA